MDVVTIIRDPRRTLGKKFTIAEDGTLAKTSVVDLTLGLAVQREAPDVRAMAAILHEVAEDPYAALCNAAFPAAPVGEEFLVVSEAELRRTLGVAGDDPREVILGGHEVTHQGRTIKAIGRLKENVRASSWQLLDRDVDEHTPERFRCGADAWLGFCESLLPGVTRAARVMVPSASSRVQRDGEPVGNGSGHIWVQVKEPGDVERVRTAIRLRALQAGMTWAKPRKARGTGEALPTASISTILDYSTWTPGRLVFDGRPTAQGEGLEVLPAAIEVVEGGRLDTSLAETPEAAVVTQLLRQAGLDARLHVGAAGELRLDLYDLHLHDTVETEGEGETTVERLMLRQGKIRCQSPFRESRSWAAFFSRGADDGRPFVHDVGTGETHWLAGLEWFTSARVIDELRRLPQGEIRAKWPAMTADLPPADVEAVIEQVVHLTGISKRAAAAELKRWRGEQKRRAREAATAAAAGKRVMIVLDVTRQAEAARRVKKLVKAGLPPERCTIFGGALCRVVVDDGFELAHAADREDVPVVMMRFAPHTEATLQDVVEEVAAFVGEVTGPDGLPAPKPIAVPAIIPRMMQDLPEGLPRCSGLLAAPAVLPSGRILSAPGLDAATGLYVPEEAHVGGLRAYTHPEALEAGRRLEEFLFDGFEFDEDLDRAVAMSGLFCLAQRRLMDAAPGLCIVAAAQSTGKTSLAGRIFSAITGRPLPVLALSLGRGGASEELDKQVLSTLIASPVAMVIDNVADGTHFRSEVLARIMTASVYEGRLLGGNRIVAAPTAVMQIITGNNLTLGLDEASRFLTTRLVAMTDTPHKRRFRNPNILHHAIVNRQQVVRDLVGIIAGHKAALDAFTADKAPTQTRFAKWEEYVRQPMLWALPGLPDVAGAFDREINQNETTWVQRAIVLELHRIFGREDFTAAAVSEKTVTIGGLAPAEPQLAELVRALGVRDVTDAAAIGKALRTVFNRPFAADDNGAGGGLLSLTKWRTMSARGWRVAQKPKR
jgi:hypothetical protein